MGVKDNLLEGFLLDRDKETFVYSNTDNRLGWEDDLDFDDAYSVHTVGREEYTQEERHKISHNAAKNIVSVMDVPFKCNVTFDKANNYYDGKTVHIATSVLDDNDLDFPEQLDVIKGLTVHETAHALSTEWNQFKYFVNKNSKEPIKKFIFNILEDERIERLVGDETPGYSRFLEKTKDYMFDKKYLDAIPDESKMTDADKVLNELLKLVRYPKYLDEEKLDEFEDELFEIKDTLMSFPKGYPMTQNQIEEATDKVFDTVKKYCERKEDEEESEGGSSDSDSSEGDSKAPKESKTPKMSEEMAKALETVVHGADESLDSEDMSDYVQQNPDEIREMEETASFDGETSFEFAPINNNESRYNSIKARVSATASTISKSLRWESKNKIDVLTRLKNGALDTNYLVEARQRVDNIYFRQRKVKSEKVSVVLLLDESGSMNGDRINKTIETSVLFIEALKKVPHVDLFIYGHTADMDFVFKNGLPNLEGTFMDNCRTNIIIYKEPGFDNTTSVTAASARSQNRDGHAILSVAKRVRKFTNNKILYLVISDGQPSAYMYSGYQHTKESVEKVERMGMHVVQIAIDKAVPSEKMFKRFVKFTNLNDLSRDMGRLMRTLVSKLSSTVVD